MNQTLKNVIEDTFSNDFNIAQFRRFIIELFNEFNFDSHQNLNQQLTQAEKLHISNFEFLGSYKDRDDQVIDILVVELQKGYKIERARNFQRNIIGKYLKNNFEANTALVAFYSKDDPTWRLSFVEIDRKLENGKIKTVVETPAKRYSFLVGKGESTHTAQKQLIEVLSVEKNILIQNIKNAFSIEKVAKEFYIEVAKLFTILAGGERKIGKENMSEVGLLKLPSGQTDKIRKEFAVRLIGRVLFCWFLKKKKSEDGTSLLSDELLSSNAIDNNPNYYHNVLEPLFFEVLNTPILKRENKYKKFPWDKTPFLNGGLFEPLIKDFYKFDETTETSQYLNTLKIPDEWFKELFELFETYNFTIDESTSIDVDLSIDPEMLGRVFENLLAEINPETGKSARKSTGSYYTPRPIVEYMVDESLKQYLISTTKIEKEKIEKLISYDNEENGLSKDDKIKIVEAFDKIKILDPACGSGAFPLGALQKMIHILQKVDPEAKLWLEKLLDDIKDPSFRSMLEKKLKNEQDLFDYTRKLGLIQKSIFGVDIQEIAIEISKLRCFLSLVVDEKIVDSEDNRGIQPLPNLEFKFVAANTLIGIANINTENQLFSLDDEIDDLKKARNEYFSSYGEKKIEVMNNFKKIQKSIFKRILDDNNLDMATLNAGKQLVQWDPFANKSADWFDPEWMFGIKDGFDIVIGNPPYIQIQKFSGKSEQKLWQAQNFKTYQRTGDIYALFYEKGFQILKQNGVLAFITSNKWMRAGYGKSLRSFFAGATSPIELIDFGGYKVFEAATVDTNILIGKNQKNSNNQFYACTLEEDFSIKSDLSLYFEKNKQIMPEVNENAWIISSEIEQKIKKKIEAIGTPLKDWDINIYRGILTGYNEAFIIDGKTKDELIAQDPKSAEIIKPILRGRDIKRYYAEFADLWLINTHNGYLDSDLQIRIPPIDINDYPAIKEHLDKYWDKLVKRQDKGVTPYNLRNCAYLEEFEKEKIGWKAVGKNLKFSIIEKGTYITAPAAFLTSLFNRYIVSILQSKMVLYRVLQDSDKTGAGDVMLNIQSFERLPIPKIPKTEQKPFEELVDKIIEAKQSDPQADTSHWEREIDNMVYKLYGLTEEEIKVVEGG